MELRRRALQWLMLGEPSTKATQLREWASCAASTREVDEHAVLSEPAGLPGRPDTRDSWSRDRLPQRSPFSPRAALRCCTRWRTSNSTPSTWRSTPSGGSPQMPRSRTTWSGCRVASEEAAALRRWWADHLQDARPRLWRLRCARWSVEAWPSARVPNPLARMALVPRTLEARGLDVTPAMREKFVRAGDEQAARILDVILRDEIGHVAVGNRWYRWLCAREGRDPITTYDELAAQYRAPRPKPPVQPGGPARRRIRCRRTRGLAVGRPVARRLDTLMRAPQSAPHALSPAARAQPRG